MKTRLVNFRLDEQVIGFLDAIAERGGNRSKAVRQAAQAAAGILLAARRQSISRLLAIRERFGPDAQVTAWVSQNEDGDPLGHLLIDGEEPEGVRAVPLLIPGGVLLFLNVPGIWNPAESVLARFGDQYAYIPEAAFPLGQLPWPPDPRKGIVMKMADLDQVIDTDPMLAEPEAVEA